MTSPPFTLDLECMLGSIDSAIRCHGHVTSGGAARALTASGEPSTGLPKMPQALAMPRRRARRAHGAARIRGHADT